MRSRLVHFAFSILLVSGAMVAFPEAAPAATTFTNVDDPLGTTTTPLGINSRGDIVGKYTDTSACPHLHGFVLKAGSYTTLADPAAGTTLTSADGINPRGDIVGFYSVKSGCISRGGPPKCSTLEQCHGFLYRSGRYTTLDAQISHVTVTATRALGINPRGDIVGRYDDSNGGQHGFLFSRGTWSTIDFPGAVLTNAWGINSHGDIVGFYSVKPSDPTCAPECHSFLRSRDGSYTTLVVRAAGNSPRVLARGINSGGDIVGAYDDSDGNGAPFLLSDGISSTLPVPGVDRDAFGINTRGDVVGNYINSSGDTHGYRLSTQSEPGEESHRD